MAKRKITKPKPPPAPKPAPKPPVKGLGVIQTVGRPDLVAASKAAKAARLDKHIERQLKPRPAEAPPPEKAPASKGRAGARRLGTRGPAPGAGGRPKRASKPAKGKALAKAPAWPSPLEPGVYFGLPAALHHADAALGSGDVRRLLIGAPEYWYDSALNPERPQYEPTKPQEFGTAMHKLVVEGPAAFRASYDEPPDPEGLLVTDDDIARRLADLGDDDPPRKKTDKIIRLLELEPDARVKDLFLERAAKAGRTVLARDEYARIVQGATLLANDPEYREAFVGGEPEVTIIYDRPDGVRCKARIDYLKPRALVDLKTIGNTRGMQFKRAVLTQFWNYRYDLQAEHYGEARRHLPELARKGAIFGKVDREWLKQFDPTFAFVFIYFASHGAPVHWGFKLSPGNTILQIARDHIEAAIENYKKFRAEYGERKIWLMRDPLSELDINDFPSFAYR